MPCNWKTPLTTPHFSPEEEREVGKNTERKIRIFQSYSVQSHLTPILKALLDTRLISEPRSVDVETGGDGGDRFQPPKRWKWVECVISKSSGTVISI